MGREECRRGKVECEGASFSRQEKKHCRCRRVHHQVRELEGASTYTPADKFTRTCSGQCFASQNMLPGLRSELELHVK